MFAFPRGKRATLLAQGGAPFTPASISGLTAWYDFSDAATLFTDSARTTPVASDGDSIGGVQDKSGNAKHLSASGTARPTYKTAIQNSKSMALGDGAGNVLSASDFAAPLANTTIFAIAKEISATQSNKQFFSGKTDAALHVLGNITNTWVLFAGTVLNGSAANTNCNMWTAQFNGASSSIQINAAAATTGDAGSQSLGGVRLFGPSSSTAYWDGYVGEVLVYNSVLSAGNIALIKTYLNAKWAVYGQTLISDGFSGTDAASINGRTPDTTTTASATWAEVFSPAPVIDTNQIKAGAAAASAAHISCGVSDFTVTVDYTYRGEKFNGILVRSSDSSNYYRIYHDTGNWTFQKREAGSNSTLATIAQTLTSGVTYTLKVVCSGTTIGFYVDDVLKSEQTGQTFNQTATRAGVLLSNASGTVSRFDNFKITN